MIRLAAKGIVHPEMKIVLEFTHPQVFMLFLFRWNTEENIYIFAQLYDSSSLIEEIVELQKDKISRMWRFSDIGQNPHSLSYNFPDPIPKYIINYKKVYIYIYI